MRKSDELEVEFISDQDASISLLLPFCATEEAPRRVQELMLSVGTSGKKPGDGQGLDFQRISELFYELCKMSVYIPRCLCRRLVTSHEMGNRS